MWRSNPVRRQETIHIPFRRTLIAGERDTEGESALKHGDGAPTGTGQRPWATA